MLMYSVRSGAREASCFWLSSSCFSRAAISSAGATSSTLPTLRLSRPLVLRIRSSAWSQGTLCSRRVILPLTVSDATRLRSVKSAISCSTERTSMSWKFSDSFSPVYLKASRRWRSFSASVSGLTLMLNWLSAW